jgi:hypothetical protein
VVVALLGTGVALALGGGGTDLGDAAAPGKRARATAASDTQPSTTSTTVTTVPTPRTVAELFTVLASNPGAYGRRGPELADKLGKVVTGRDEDGSEARKLTEEIPRWVAAGELDPEVGNLTVQLLGPYLGGSPFGSDEGSGGDEDGNRGKGNDKGGD